MSSAGGFIDLQVNGYGGVDFNQDDLSAGHLHSACLKLSADGVAGILATIITDHISVMADRLRRLVELRESDALAREMILGLHIEGPFISSADGYRGAHPEDAVSPANLDEMKRLLDAGNGLTKIVTLAPEQDSGCEATKMLAEQNIIVSAGHTDASIDQLKAAIDAGLSMFTHLGNGCPLQLHRHENIIQRALSQADQLYLSFIADGVHVPFTALGNYMRLAGLDHCVIVTDAMSAAGLGPGRHALGRWEVEVGQDLSAWAPDRSHLVGSAMTMPQVIKNLTENASLTQAEAEDLTINNPARLLGREG